MSTEEPRNVEEQESSPPLHTNRQTRRSSDASRRSSVEQLLNNVKESRHFTRQQKKSNKSPFMIRCLASGLFIFILFLIPFLATIAMKRRGNLARNDAFLYSAAAFCITSNLISIRGIFLHMFHWVKPNIQTYILIILFMVPAFATCSFVALKFQSFGIYLHVLLDLYESMVLVSFLYMLIEMLGGEGRITDILEGKDQSHAQHKCCCKFLCPVWKMGEPFYQEIKWGILQFIIIQTLCALTVLIFYPLNHYDEDHFTWNNAYTYVSVFSLASMIWAFYSIGMFYHAVQEELTSPKNWHPIQKFAAFKIIIVVSTIQTKIISGFVQAGVISQVEQWDADQIASALQHYLICVEMVIMSVANSFIFSYKECLDEETDVIDEEVEMLEHNRHGRRSIV